MLSSGDKKWIEDFFNAKIMPAVHDAVKLSQVRKMRLVDCKSEPGNQIAMEKDVNIIDVVAGYLPDVAKTVAGFHEEFSKFNNRFTKTMSGIIEYQKKNVELLENSSKKEGDINAG